FEPQNNPNDMKTKKPLGPFLLVLAVCIIATIAHAAMKINSLPDGTPSASIEAIRKKYNLPALAVVVTKGGQICDRAAAGVRKWGDTTRVTTNDVFHIGSCTKSMTATLAAIFIEQRKLRWDTTIAEVFPELKGKMDKRYETVTVEQLLHHRGGVPHNPPTAAWLRAWQEIGTPVEQRRKYIEAVLSAPPEAEPGTKMIYSNDGYVIVGVMLEKISGRDFESLMTEKLFKPLHMDSAGFGPPGTKGQIDQPWGHVRKLFMTLPMQSDNPPVHSPCGRVHCSLDDLARYAMFHLQQGTNGLLKPETMARLHAAPVGLESENPMENYACGWVRLKRSWAGGPVLWHNGSNTMWYIVMWLAPEKDFCVIAATNIAGDDAEKACDDACVAMIEKWLPEK
ncbi:MAG TPA: serine hydrolase domain-containing protein, partial [Candidatus Polarisedimenticolia bacterium]|nr:serine hydrolase domain-containing protein [Candidatus Polarisedimenticolia bacterium]